MDLILVNYAKCLFDPWGGGGTNILSITDRHTHTI